MESCCSGALIPREVQCGYLGFKGTYGVGYLYIDLNHIDHLDKNMGTFARPLATVDAHIVLCPRKVDVRLPGKGNSNSRGARSVYQNHFDD